MITPAFTTGPTHRGTRAIQTLVEFAPSTGGLALWVQHRDLPDGREAITVANDGHTIFYGPAFERLPHPQQVGLVAHQVLHVALRHPQRMQAIARLRGSVDPALFNICADAIVNSSLGHLTWMALPKGSVTLGGLLDDVLQIQQSEEKSLLEWDVERLYRQIDDRRPSSDSSSRQSSQSSREGDGGSGPAREGQGGQAQAMEDGPRAARTRQLGADILRDLLPSDEDALKPETVAEQSREWAQRITRAHAGDGDFSMLRGLIADLPRVKVPWEQVLRTRVSRGLARRPEVSWSRPSRSYLANRGRAPGGRRMPWEPGMVTAASVPRLVLVVDVSGSIDEALLGRFATEIEAITRRTESRLVVIIGDTRVRAVEELEPGVSNLRDIVFEGGGGTDFTPLLQAADRYRPDMGVVLTDLQGPAGFRPGWPVLWVVSAAFQDAEPPFGTRLVLAD
ncbi:hypothetical protein CKO35_11820 [Ectothiorhodospira shaposhnikovii]|uniref:vWA domain-containing protein n=1 Tax=Ectothiorhodospira shaposhnikovii TaxID=1054 RepID=UPI001906D740|nr:VWA-like domain-containing protein [Ectothiorhodospira shaposhnikovii]MBK1673982.1 hypothetical protein [Ectothiorhodospira shaposhnikovii]